MSSVKLNTGKTAFRQEPSRIDELPNDVFNIRNSHFLWNAKSHVPDDRRHTAFSNFEWNWAGCQRGPKDASFACASRRLATRMANLSDNWRVLLLAGGSVLLPRL